MSLRSEGFLRGGKSRTELIDFLYLIVFNYRIIQLELKLMMNNNKQRNERTIQYITEEKYI